MAKIIASVILPTYNEAGNIIKLVESLRFELGMERITFEILVIDDNSPDKTGLLAQKYFSKDTDVRVIIRKKDKGLAKSIREGIESATGQIMVVMDTDFNHEPRLVPRLVKKCQKYDIAVGSRFIRGGGMANKRREILSKAFNQFLIQPLIDSPIKDNLCGFFAIKFDKLEDLDFGKIFFGYGDYFIRLIYYARKKGYSFTEIPSFYVDRTYGESKSNFIGMFREYALSAIRLRLGLID